ncbi:hypothetical protein WAI453_010529 [Rhynchosporium graminicola]
MDWLRIEEHIIPIARVILLTSSREAGLGPFQRDLKPASSRLLVWETKDSKSRGTRPRPLPCNRKLPVYL